MKNEIVIGIDEVGRGCLCGPVCAAAVIIRKNFKEKKELADSKELSQNIREKLALSIRRDCLGTISWAYPHEIDKINIHNASLLAMKRAFEQLYITQRHLFEAQDTVSIKIDGKFIPAIEIGQRYNIEAIIKGDTLINEIKAASILAKTARDSLMQLYDQTYPVYQLAKHKGYPTPFHKKALSIYGPSPIHRLSFKLKY